MRRKIKKLKPFSLFQNWHKEDGFGVFLLLLLFFVELFIFLDKLFKVQKNKEKLKFSYGKFFFSDESIFE